MSTNPVLLYGRPGCHLCEDARPIVARAAALARLAVLEVDIDADPELAVDYGLRIPVVEGPSGRVLAEGRVEYGPLVRAMIADRLGLSR